MSKDDKKLQKAKQNQKYTIEERAPYEKQALLRPLNVVNKINTPTQATAKQGDATGKFVKADPRIIFEKANQKFNTKPKIASHRPFKASKFEISNASDLQLQSKLVEETFSPHIDSQLERVDRILDLKEKISKSDIKSKERENLQEALYSTVKNFGYAQKTSPNPDSAQLTNILKILYRQRNIINYLYSKMS
jgi:hypothetical protein